MDIITREIEKNMLDSLFQGKAIILYGPRQAGKTTLLESLSGKIGGKILLLNGDEPDVRDLLNNVTSTRLKNIIGDNKVLIIDEAQRINNIGITLKLITDNLKNVQVIASGSSSFELADKTKEPLTGRKFEFKLLPFSFAEMVNHTSLLEEKRMIEKRLVYGYYPEIVTNPDNAKKLIKLIAGSYLYKDLLTIDKIRNTELLDKILKALAFQVGYEVSFYEIGQLTNSDHKTVEKYIDLLEKTFVIFRLTAYSRNVRNEIKKGRKIYFYDNGIRNAIIGNFNHLINRTDKGNLWENFVVSERKKFLTYRDIEADSYFWRTTQKQEIDYLEVKNDKIYAYEIKYSHKAKCKFPDSFTKNYKIQKKEIINNSNFEQFLT